MKSLPQTKAAGTEVDDVSPGDVIWADEEGNIMLDDSIMTFNRVKAKRFLQRG